MTFGAHPDLAAAVALSRDVVEAADQGRMDLLAQLDARRLELLKSFRLVARQIAPADRTLLQEIAALNQRALGLVEHHRRIKGRAMDLVAIGRRAVSAYASNRPAR
jgi:molybdenum-dependent DNA-binding transcriptional regulator ModE